MTHDSIIARKYRERLLADLHRPGYHFAIPDGDGVPGDSNGAFYADGRYHLMYLYRDMATDGFHWGHLSSTDLLHWRNHPDALAEEEGDRGCFSGGAFVDDDGTAYLTFWKFPSKDFTADNGGIDIAYAKPPYETWERIRPIAVNGSKEVWGTRDVVIDGETVHLGCADPSNIWKMNGYYYMQLGNLCVLNEYGRKPDSPEIYKGDWTELFRSKDLKTWEFVHRFYANPHLGEDWPDETEDDMCPSFLPLSDHKGGGRLTDKWLQLFIAHNKGGQYYVGTVEDETFYPTEHGRCSWKDNTCFAPEALVDHKNRQIAWFWLTDNREDELNTVGWTGVYGLPREFWYDGGLRMAPVQELDNLQYNGQTFEVGKLSGCQPLEVKNGLSFRMKAHILPGKANYVDFTVREDLENGERTILRVDLEKKTLVMDAAKSGSQGRMICEEAPFALEEGEALDVDIFVDHSVIEIYANDRQAICRRVYPSDPARATGVSAASDGADFGTINVWEMSPTNPY